jgi:adenylate cyclase
MMPNSQIDLAREADFTLGDAIVSPSLRELRCGDATHVLEPRVMQVLVLLAGHAGQTVSRDELIERCWGGLIVGEDAIQRSIGRLRKLANQTGAFEIVTLARVGYRLNSRSADPAASKPSEQLLAVLPFDNLSNDPAFDYFADGVSEEILQSIARRSSIRVIGRTSSFQYRGNDKTIPRIIDELGASHLLDGSVRRSGKALRVSAHLMELSDQTMLWAERFDGDCDNPFDLQDAVARGAVAALSGIFDDAARADPVSGGGFDALTRLRQIAHRTSFGAEDEAVIEALASTVPTSAEAWGIVARVRAAKRWTVDPAEEPALRAAAREAAERALALDAQCGSAHMALFMLEPPAGRFAARENRLERALAGAPEDGELLWSLYFHYLSTGRLARSAEMAEEAYRVDPLRPLNVTAYANSLYTAGRKTQALALMHHAVDRWPDDANVFGISLWTAAVEGEHDCVRMQLRDDRLQRFGNSMLPINRAIFVARGILDDPAGLMAAARAQLEAAIARDQVDLSLIGLCAYLGMDLDELYTLADRCPLEVLQQPGSLLSPIQGLSHLFLRVNARLRTSPRFVRLCMRLGLVDYWREAECWPDCADDVREHYDFRAEALRP